MEGERERINLLRITIYSMYRCHVFHATCIRTGNRGGIISSVGNSGGRSSEEVVGTKVSIARDLVVLGVSSVNPRKGPFLFRDILSLVRYLSAQDVHWPVALQASILEILSKYIIYNLREACSANIIVNIFLEYF